MTPSQPHVAVPEPLPALGFYPGGSGWFPPATPRASAKIVVVGQDFGTWEYFQRLRLGSGGESVDGPTWKPLLSLLRRASIDPSECFFTNALLGLRAQGAMTGVSPGWRDPVLVKTSLASLGDQIRRLKARTVLVLGLPAARGLGRFASSIRAWRAVKTWRALDEVGPLALSVPELGHARGAPSVAALLHPSFRRVNLRRRRYGGLVGDDAELALIGDAVRRMVS